MAETIVRLPGDVVLESGVRLSQSRLWKLQRAYYSTAGTRAWAEAAVPCFVSSNAFLAAAYAKAILAYMRDWFSSPDCDRNQPIYIVEAAAGHGRLSFLIARELMDAWEAWPDLGTHGDAAEGGAGSPLDAFGRGPGGRRVPFRMVVTDFSAANASFWARQEAFAPLVEAGVVDFGLLDLEPEGEGAAAAPMVVQLALGGGALVPGALRNPLVCVANYAWDSLTQEAFRVSPTGSLQLGRVTLMAPASAADGDPVDAFDRADPALIKALRLGWEYEDVSAVELTSRMHPAVAPYVSPLLAHYCEQVPPGYFLLPVGGLELLARVCELGASGRALVLVGDKGYCHEEELADQRDPSMAVHESFSFMANLHAGRLFALARGGFALTTSYVEGFKCAAYVMGPLPGDMGAAKPAAAPAPIDWSSAEAVAAAAAAGLAAARASLPRPLTAGMLAAAAATSAPDAGLAAWPELSMMWADGMDHFGPENFATLQRTIREEIPDGSGTGGAEGSGPTLRTSLALLRLSNWDPDVFFRLRTSLINGTPSAPEKLAADIYRDVRRVYARYYPLQPHKDIAFELARMCMGLRCHAEAIALFLASVRHTGDNYITAYNVGICCYHLGDMGAALAAFDRALAAAPSYQDAANWRKRVVQRLQEAGVTVAGAAAGSAHADASHSHSHSHSHGHGEACSGHGHGVGGSASGDGASAAGGGGGSADGGAEAARHAAALHARLEAIASSVPGARLVVTPAGEGGAAAGGGGGGGADGAASAAAPGAGGSGGDDCFVSHASDEGEGRSTHV